MKLELVIIASEQFGYNPATYYYCKYLRDRYRITYLGWDHNLDRIEMNGVQVEYVARCAGPARIFRFLRKIVEHTRSPDTIIFLKYFKIISTVIRLVRWKNRFVLDVRTGSVEPNKIHRFVQDSILKLECKLFENITVISKGLACKLNLANRATILSLGADVISNIDKKYNELNLLYVGTLCNRNIAKTVEGFTRFLSRYEKEIPSKFTIIGAGSEDETGVLKRLVREGGSEKKVHVLGRIPHDQLQKYFDSHNVGVAYVPITDYYNVQPVTKTFEYLLSGMPVLATATSENKCVINHSNGVLTGDTSEEFFRGLVVMHNRLRIYNSKQIRIDALRFNWENITEKLDHYLTTLES